ncbi:Citrate synthase protein [Raphanus sativus]|uniref:Citrate synthase 4, mitochondrial-like isoform X4 n=1 Tax=Raphanus sativus TaxID=3726 RepID=A0A9W3CY24_RAPSA|nr:citrate synthase 4, mitochondrial-like isoform X4 [Raphanus sativus]KAJ4910195.1 Citrate synthase protein [Raphanus sativus]
MANPAACMVSSSNSVRWIQMQRSTDMDLKSQLQELIPEQQDRPKKLKSEHGKVQLGNITVDMVIGGMRGMTGLLWETSLLDPEEDYLICTASRNYKNIIHHRRRPNWFSI